ncbi:hypothetical protein CARN8_2990001 [mine drainage metagenome]|uniref:Uncharacterized protein n=1 Tax=mine drainage metagenome TaxID=410659 RepID=A0A3P3ZNL9_9ZZZZ
MRQYMSFEMCSAIFKTLPIAYAAFRTPVLSSSHMNAVTLWSTPRYLPLPTTYSMHVVIRRVPRSFVTVSWMVRTATTETTWLGRGLRSVGLMRLIAYTPLIVDDHTDSTGRTNPAGLIDHGHKLIRCAWVWFSILSIQK